MLCAGRNYTENLEIRVKYVHYLSLFSFNNVIKKLYKTKTPLRILDFFLKKLCQFVPFVTLHIALGIL